MAKISDTSSYPNITPASGDYLVLTDVSDSNNTKTVTVQALSDFIGGGGGGTPGGSDTQMQYNDGGSFGGTTGLTWDDSTNLTVSNILEAFNKLNIYFPTRDTINP